MIETAMSPPRNWSELPDLLLLSVVRLLPSLLDFFAFAGVCRSWRSLLRSSAAIHYLSSRPPLLLLPKSQILQTLTLDSTFESLIPPPSSSPLCLGCSHGHLILLRRLSPAHHLPLLCDALTGAQITPPPLPPNRFPYYYAALTAPPSSSHSGLLLFYSQHHFLYHRLGGGTDWSTHRLNPSVHITRVLPFKNRVLAVNDRANKLLEFEFGRELTVKVFEVEGICKGTVFDRWHFGPQLVECGPELLLVLFVQRKPQLLIAMIDVYKLDFERVVWVKVEELRDYALFVDCGGKSPVSCYKPEQWGGRSNCVYLTGPGSESWNEFPLGTGREQLLSPVTWIPLND